MTTRIIPVALLSIATIGFTACSNSKGGGGAMKKVKGLEYQIIKDKEGPTAKIGEVIEFHIVAKADTVTLNDTWKMGRPGAQRVDTPRNAVDLQAVFPMLSAGDSAVVYISCDSILAGIPEDQRSSVPSWLHKGNKVTINLSVLSIKSEEDYNKDMQAKQAEEMKKMEEEKAARKPMDDKILKDYFAKNNIQPRETENGLYYTIEKPGSGAQIKTGQTVSMKYTGKLLDGKIFDTNVDPEIAKKNGHDTKDLTFSVGMHQMISGVDEGVGLLKKGTKATLYLPSGLAYGPQSPNPDIPANAVMIFEVEITDVKDAPAPAAH